MSVPTPTAIGWKGLLFYATLVTSFYAAPYANLFFLLLVFLTGLAILDWIWTARNLSGVDGGLAPPEPTAAGTTPVFRGWIDGGRRRRYALKLHLSLDNAGDASREMGFDIGPLNLIAVENTADTHNLIVCTLCSCYPRNLLGLPPDWYKTREYRSRAVREPRAVLREFGVDLPAGTTVRVHDSTADMRYIVLPARPEGTDALSEAELADLVTRDSMIGTGVPRAPTPGS